VNFFMQQGGTTFARDCGNDVAVSGGLKASL
jgi:hypothetical protein